MPAGTGEAWQLEDVRVIDSSSKPASQRSLHSDEAASEADSAKWTLVSRLLADSQPPPPSSSGRSTPSNLERAVLLLESEGAETQKATAGRQTATDAARLNSTASTDGASREEQQQCGAAAPGSGIGGDSSSGGKEQAAAAMQEAHAEQQVSEELDLAEARASLRKLSTAAAGGQGGEPTEEGPCTPPNGLAPVRSSGAVGDESESPCSPPAGQR